MTRPSATGRAGSAVLDPYIEAAVESVGTRAHTASVEVRGASVAGEIDPDDGSQQVTSPLYYTGTARVQALSVPADTEAAGVPIHSRRYLVQLARVVEAGAGMRVVVVSSTDTMLTGRVLQVRSGTRGSVRAQRDLICTLEGQEPTPDEVAP